MRRETIVVISWEVDQGPEDLHAGDVLDGLVAVRQPLPVSSHPSVEDFSAWLKRRLRA